MRVSALETSVRFPLNQATFMMMQRTPNLTSQLAKQHEEERQPRHASPVQARVRDVKKSVGWGRGEAVGGHAYPKTRASMAQYSSGSMPSE